MKITLNGEGKEVPDGMNVRELLQHLDIRPERVAVEINEAIVRKVSYGDTPVKEGDRVEVVQFMGGGGGTVPFKDHRSMFSVRSEEGPWKRNRS